MRILIFNWRDIKNPTSGGAEILTHELAKRWVRNGNKVVIFCSAYKKAKKSEVIDGVEVIREGNPDARHLWNSVHFRAFLNYQKRFKGKFDVVVDEIHGLPFFTPLYVREKKIALICEVAGDLWYKVYGSVFGQFGRLVEIAYIRFFYQHMHFLAISQSTRKDLYINGIKSQNIDVIPMGVKLPDKIKSSLKEKDKTLLFVGRLSRQKGIEDAIEVLEKVLKTIPSAKLWIVGRGEESYKNYLKQITEEKKLGGKVIFFGYVSEDEKFMLMSRAHLLLVPSIKEGFGLTIPEAGFAGTPSVSYDVQGVRDIIKNKENGILVDPNTRSMSAEVLRLLNSEEDYNFLKKNIKKFHEVYNFDKSAAKTLDLIKKYACK